MSLLRNLAALALGVALLGTVAVAQNEDTPLGDVARQQSGKKAVVTVDDDNFQRSTPPPAPAADTAKSGDSAKADAGDKGDAASSPDDVKALEQQLAGLKQKRDAVNKSIAGLEVNIRQSEGDVQQSMINAQAAYKEQLPKLNEDIAATEKKLDAARASQKSDSGDDSAKPAESKTGDNSSKPADTKPDESAKSK